MSHKLKALGLTLFAVFALSATMASGASAAEELFHSEVTNTTLVASQDGEITSSTGLQTFHTTLGKLTCGKVSGQVTIAAKTVEEVTIAPTYEHCEKEGVKTDVHFETCDYLFTSKKTTGATHSEVHIKCTKAGDHIRINATILGSQVACAEVPAQTPTGGGVTYHNIGTGTTREITITATVTGIEYTEVGACGKSTVANDGEYTGNVLVTGTNATKEHVGLWWE